MTDYVKLTDRNDVCVYANVHETNFRHNGGECGNFTAEGELYGPSVRGGRSIRIWEFDAMEPVEIEDIPKRARKELVPGASLVDDILGCLNGGYIIAAEEKTGSARLRTSDKKARLKSSEVDALENAGFRISAIRPGWVHVERVEGDE